MAAAEEFPGCILYSFLSRFILFPCWTTTTLLWGEVMIRGLGGLVGMLEQANIMYSRKTEVKNTGKGMWGHF